MGHDYYVLQERPCMSQPRKGALRVGNLLRGSGQHTGQHAGNPYNRIWEAVVEVE